MYTRYFARFVGIVLILLGLLGFVPGVTQPASVEAPDLTVHLGYGLLFGVFPANILLDLVRLLAGIDGVFAARGFLRARAYSRRLAALLGVLAVCGFIPGLTTFFGLMPLYDWNIVLHAALGLVAAYYGFVRGGQSIADLSHPAVM